jgi:hypothetical protein
MTSGRCTDVRAGPLENWRRALWDALELYASARGLSVRRRRGWPTMSQGAMVLRQLNVPMTEFAARVDALVAARG